ncbi:MAG: phosphatase PAP2 family protein [Clostridia bacterium]|nr:phosphatase PAP2 family protein [Clostridia bacterium]
MEINLKENIRGLKNIVVKNLRWIFMLIFAIMFITILDNVMNQEIYKFDVTGYELVTMRMTDSITWIAKIITKMASPVVLILIAYTLYSALKNKKIKYSIVTNLVVATLLNFTIKNIIQRPRPVGHRLIDESGYSFPSGHSMVSMAFYGYLIFIINSNVKSKSVRIISTIVLGALIILIGLSRIYLGVHYASDVFGGFCIALSYLMLYTGVVKKMLNEK